MATSGSTTINVDSNGYLQMKISWSLSSQSTSNNTSTIAFKAQLIAGSAGAVYSSASKAYTAVINGTTYSGTNSVAISNNATTTLFSKSLTITHDSDGSKSFTYQYTQTFDIDFNGTIGNKSASLTVTPTTIARASSITSASTVTLGNAVSIKWTPASKTFYYKLKFVVGDKSSTQSVGCPGTTSAYTYTGYTMSIATWAPYITTATSDTCTVTLTTYSDSGYSTKVGSSSSTFTVKVPSSCVPTVSVSASEGNSTVSGSGVTVYVSGKSKLTLAITATMSYDSAISSISATIGSDTYSPSKTTTSTGATASVTSGTLSGTSSISYKVTATDKRGRTSSSVSGSVTPKAYSSPSVDTFTVQRCNSSGTVSDSGTYAKVTYAWTMTSLTGGSCSAVISYKKNSASSWTQLLSSTSATQSSKSSTYCSGNCSVESAYDFRLVLTDPFTSTTKTISMSTEEVLMDFNPDGKGIAFGKLSEVAERVESGWPFQVTASTDNLVDGAVIEIISSGTSGDTYFKATSWSSNRISFGVGSGGINRGVYDGTDGEWLIYASTVGNGIAYSAKQSFYIGSTSNSSSSSRLYGRCASVSGGVNTSTGSNVGVYQSTLGSWLCYMNSAGVAYFGTTSYASYLRGSTVNVTGTLYTSTNVYVGSNLCLENAKYLYFCYSSGTYRSTVAVTADNYIYFGAAGETNRIYIGTYGSTNYIYLRCGTLYRYNSSNVSFKIPEFQSGTQSITPSAANTATGYAITFSKTFSGTPAIQVTPNSTASTLMSPGYSSVSSTGVTLYVTRSNTTATTLGWVAFY